MKLQLMVVISFWDRINAVFSVGNMLMRYYSTYDESYARKVYPYLLACADFWEDYLSLENGRYVIRIICRNNLFFSHVVYLLFDKKISQQGYNP